MKSYKFYWLILICFSLFTDCYSQAPIIQSNGEYEKGIYLTWEEFKANRPQLKFYFEVESIKSTSDNEFVRYNITFDNIINVDVNLDSVWGFSDGENIYVNSRLYQYEKGFLKLEGIGRYCFFRDVIDVNTTYGINYLYNTWAFQGHTNSAILLNINNGKFYDMSKSLMKKVLESEPQLLKEYLESDNRIDTKFKYLEKYNQLNIDEMKEAEGITVCFYRRNRRESDEKLTINVNGEFSGTLDKNDYLTVNISDPINVNIIVNDKPFVVTLSELHDNYIFCSLTDKDKKLKVEWVDTVKGKFYVNKLKYSKNKNSN